MQAETVPIEDEPTSRLFVRNLAYSVGEDDLRSVFEIHGPINEVSLVLHGRTSFAGPHPYHLDWRSSLNTPYLSDSCAP